MVNFSRPFLVNFITTIYMLIKMPSLLVSLFPPKIKGKAQQIAKQMQNPNAVDTPEEWNMLNEQLKDNLIYEKFLKQNFTVSYIGPISDKAELIKQLKPLNILTSWQDLDTPGYITLGNALISNLKKKLPKKVDVNSNSWPIGNYAAKKATSISSR
ncbi:MAG: hypothetical protein OMM_05381 [Candidatus Magnetoglobus multicellularis str. Araruama]|uniref:Uncharacterized protein n=1 Tax=Candidatus Magnetoglobus multicellularis str. Araruama TaxID=890399 RepID=A0A1V1NWQ3_9BACT|nr:MAG: hypothetical protein OMM_05381 [Candidatus Magnetoglobus multicellularis str. Araruama]